MADFSGAIIKSMGSWDRKPADFYPTPADVTQALLDFIKPSKGLHFHEPACGQGHMSRVLKENGLEVTSSDLFDRGYGRTGVNFLSDETDPFDADFILTNPPFAVAEEFIRRCWELEVPFFAMLLKDTYWSTKKRKKLWRDCPPMLCMPLTWRPAFLKSERGNNPLMGVQWCYWERGFQHEMINGEPLAMKVPLDRPSVFPDITSNPLTVLLAELREALAENAHARA